jgi:hypothetical protein
VSETVDYAALVALRNRWVHASDAVQAALDAQKAAWKAYMAARDAYDRPVPAERGPPEAAA